MEEPAQPSRLRVPLMADHDRARRRRLGGDAFEPARSGDAIAR